METKNKFATIKIICIVAMLLMFIPANAFSKITSGLDSSWQYALNYLVKNDYVWGRDVVFTYGPLGFLLFTKNVGNNIQLSLVFWMLITAMHIFLLWQAFYRGNNKNIYAVVCSSVIYVIAAVSLGTEEYIEYLALFALILSWKQDKRNLIIADVLMILSFFMKLSIFVAVFSGMVMCVLLLWIYNDAKKKSFTVVALSGLVSIPVCYLVFVSHSFSDLVGYIRGSYEIVKGYNYAMSINEYDRYMLWIILIVLVYIALCFVFLFTDKNNFCLLAFFAGPLFMYYKHGFVRADGHVNGAFAGLLVVFSSVIFFTDWEVLSNKVRLKRCAYSCVAFIVLVPVIFLQINFGTVLSSVKGRIIDFPGNTVEIIEQDMEESSLISISDGMAEIIGDSTVSIYPWEISYLATNDLNYVPLPTLQAYSAYTPYLDSITSEIFTSETSPDYIVMTMDRIDGRWCFLECPKTWWAIKNNYNIAEVEEGMYLLKKKEIPNAVTLTLTNTAAVNKSESIFVEDKNAYIKIGAELNVLGKLTSIFWKITDVQMTVKYENGIEIEQRILLENLKNGVYIKSIVYDADTLVDYLNGDGEQSKVCSISFSGDGIKFYKDNINIEYYSVN